MFFLFNSVYIVLCKHDRFKKGNLSYDNTMISCKAMVRLRVRFSVMADCFLFNIEFWPPPSPADLATGLGLQQYYNDRVSG